MNKTKQKQNHNTENKQVVTRGEVSGGRREIGEADEEVQSSVTK